MLHQYTAKFALFLIEIHRQHTSIMRQLQLLLLLLFRKIPIYTSTNGDTPSTLIVRLSASSVYESPCCLFVPIRKWADSAIVFISIFIQYESTHTHTRTHFCLRLFASVCVAVAGGASSVVCANDVWLCHHSFSLLLYVYVCGFLSSPSSVFSLLLSFL